MAIYPKYGFTHTFDRNIFKKNWKKINESPLKKVGLFIRKVERGLIREDTSKKRTPSRPGKPPKSRAPGHPFRRIFSVPNYFATNVMIGHVGFGSRQTVMEIQDEGQRVKIRRRLIPNRGRNRIRDPARRKLVRERFKAGLIRNQPLQMRTETIKMPERSFRKPTMDRAKRRIPQFWANSVNKGTLKV